MWIMSEHGAKWEIEDEAFKKGGEGEIHRVVGRQDLVAKIYRDGLLTPIRQEKLAYMASLYTADALRQMAWPQEVFRDPYGNVKGFLMRRFDATEDMADLLDGTGSSMKSPIDWRKRVVVALNLSYLVNEIHTMGQAIGDMNPKNFGVNMNTGFVCAFDTDSFHICNRQTNTWYPCIVLDEHYIAPELQERLQQGARVDSFRPQDTFTVQTDRFALAVLIFQLLFLGVHPFTAARVQNRGSSVVIHRRESNIYERMCPFFNPVPGVTIPVYAPPLTIVPPAMRQMFKKAFLENDRPSAREWAEALSQLLMETESCGKGHFFAKYQGSQGCPWCNSPAELDRRKREQEERRRREEEERKRREEEERKKQEEIISKGFILVSRSARKKKMEQDINQKQKGYYDGSTPERAIVIEEKMKNAVTDRTVFTQKGKVTIPAGIEEHEMLLFRRGNEELYIQQNLTAPFVFAWVGAIGLGLWFLSNDPSFWSLLGGGFLGMFAGALLDGFTQGFWINKYRKQAGQR